MAETPRQGPSFTELLLNTQDALRRAGQRAAQWLEDHQDGVKAVVEGIAVMNALQPELERLTKRWEGTEWGHLLNQLDFTHGLALLLLLDRADRAAVEDLLEEALAQSNFVESVDRQVQQTDLPAAQKRQLGAGLEFLAARDYELAVPLLMNPLEGGPSSTKRRDAT